jgi:hypothetical protein
MSVAQPAKRPLGERLQSLPKFWIYSILLVLTTIPLFVTVSVPNEPQEPAIDLYASLMQLPEGGRVLIASDWTGSTRGESGGEFDAIIRILMRKKIKFAIYSTADPQAPLVARDSIARLNDERRKAGLAPYERFTDWVSVGYFPNSEGATNGIANDIRSVFGGRKDFPPGRPPTDIFQSPVLQGVRSVSDFPMLIVITASKTSNFTVERVYGKTPLAFAVTGVMGPETQVFYQSKQIVGFAGGLKGVYDLETMMEHGINNPGPDGKIVVPSSKYGQIPGFPGMPNKGKGTLYYPTLHVALALLILTVIIGNVGMFLSKRANQR